MTDDNNKVIDNKFLGKGKQGRFCPFRTGHYCNKNCGLFMEGLSSCVLHGINLNLQRLTEGITKQEKKALLSDS
jgi:hypothetical protein